MLCEVAALSFQVHANNGTWSIDYDGALICPITPEYPILVQNN